MKTMNIKFDFAKRIGALLLALAVLVGMLGVPQGAVWASPLAALSVSSPALIAPQSTLTGLDCTTGCDLYAKQGTLSLPGGVIVPIWGFSDTPGGPAQYPGPTIIADDNDTLLITVHNVDVPGEVALSWPTLPSVPFYTGVTAGNSQVYTLPLAQAGTYLYEAGLTADGPRQVAMGLFGALIVRPAAAPGQAYAGAHTAFDDEALVIISEIDPAFNADPLNYRLNVYAPKYFLINGKVYPDTLPIEGRVGKTLLLRQVNAGLEQRSMGVVGLRQRVVGSNTSPLPFVRTVTAETLYSGQTLDTLVTIPAAAPTGTRFTLHDAGLRYHNGAQAGFGGLITFIQVSDGLAASPGGPLAINVSISPNPTNGISGATLSATITDIFGGSHNITQAEFFIDVLGAPGTGGAMSGTFGATSVDVSAAISAGSLGALAGGEHIFYVRGLDSDGKWGLVGAVALTLDTLGPLAKTFSLTPWMTNGSVAVELHSFADETTRGGANVVAGEYFIDAPGADGSGTPMTLSSTDLPTASMSTWIATSTILALPEGVKIVSVHGQDSFGNWGAYATGTLVVDFTGPAASGVSITPSLLDFTGGPPAATVRIEATLTDALLYVDRAEAFFDTFTGNGTGFQLVPIDGLMDEMNEQVYFNIPIGQIAYFAQGAHTLFLHGRDAAGNWGALGSAAFTIDKGVVDTVGADVIALSYTAQMPRPAAGPNAAVGVEIHLMARTVDPNYYSNIAAVEWFLGTTVPANPADRHPMTATDGFGMNNSTIEDVWAEIDTTGFTGGLYTFSVRAQDSAGNWGPILSITINLDAPFQIFLPNVSR